MMEYMLEMDIAYFAIAHIELVKYVLMPNNGYLNYNLGVQKPVFCEVDLTDAVAKTIIAESYTKTGIG